MYDYYDYYIDYGHQCKNASNSGSEDVAEENRTRNYYGSYEHLKYKVNKLENDVKKYKGQLQVEEDMRNVIEAEWKKGFQKQVNNGLFMSLHPEKMSGGNVITKFGASAITSSGSNDDVIVNVKEDEKNKGKFKLRLMSDTISNVVGKNGEELPVIVKVPVKVPVEVIREISVKVSVDMTDEIQKEQLQTLKNINGQLSGMSFDIKQAKYQDMLTNISYQLSGIQNDVKDAKYQDVLSSISTQLHVLETLSSMSEISQQLSSIIANNSAVRIINA